jgi:hypothetical protein
MRNALSWIWPDLLALLLLIAVGAGLGVLVWVGLTR